MTRLRPLTALIGAAFLLPTAGMAAEPSWWDANWQQRIVIGVPETQPAGPTTYLIDFSALVPAGEPLEASSVRVVRQSDAAPARLLPARVEPRVGGSEHYVSFVMAADPQRIVVYFDAVDGIPDAPVPSPEVPRIGLFEDESFEAGRPGEPPGEPWAVGGAREGVTVSGEAACSGEQSLRFEVTGEEESVVALSQGLRERSQELAGGRVALSFKVLAESGAAFLAARVRQFGRPVPGLDGRPFFLGDCCAPQAVGATDRWVQAWGQGDVLAGVELTNIDALLMSARGMPARFFIDDVVLQPLFPRLLEARWSRPAHYTGDPTAYLSVQLHPDEPALIVQQAVAQRRAGKQVATPVQRIDTVPIAAGLFEITAAIAGQESRASRAKLVDGREQELSIDIGGLAAGEHGVRVELRSAAGSVLAQLVLPLTMEGGPFEPDGSAAAPKHAGGL